MAQVHVWEQVEITLNARHIHVNPYTDVTVWVQLRGPDFDKRIYGFWDGGQVFRVRLMATRPGSWSWTSTSDPPDPGLHGRCGSFTAADWNEAERQQNPNRRGIIRAGTSGHGLVYADGTPFFLLADTWWAAFTWRYPFKGLPVNARYVPASGMTFEQGVQYLRAHGYNSLAIISAFPNWDTDGYSCDAQDKAGVYVRRHAWYKAGNEGTAKDMHDEHGNRPFMLPGRCDGLQDLCPDYDRINPAYFQSVDRKMDYLWENGFVPFIESVRRDALDVWRVYHDFEASFPRYLNYLAARYGAHNWIFSLVHGDYWPDPQVPGYCAAAFDTYYHTYGPPPFGQPTTAMADRSTLYYFGHVDQAPWLQLHSVGNWERDRRIYAYLEAMYEHDDPIPAFNNEPYYTALPYAHNDVAGERAEPNSERDSYFARAQMYGSALSGGLAGHVYGTVAYAGNTTGEPRSEEAYIWEALTLDAGAQLQHLGTFILSEGLRYQELSLASYDLCPRRSAAAVDTGLDGWAYMMCLPDRSLALLYFENLCERATVQALRPGQPYRAQWFDPRTGAWIDAGALTADAAGSLELPPFPDGRVISDTDWAMKLRVEA